MDVGPCPFKGAPTGYTRADCASPAAATTPSQTNCPRYMGWPQCLFFAVVGLIVVLTVSLRLTILYPAIAVDARGATASNALADTKGHVFSIFMIFLLALLPLAAIAIVVTLMLGPGVRDAGTPVAIAQLVTSAIIQTITIPLCVAIASRIFQALADRVSQQA
jgi:hypothetical protein